MRASTILLATLIDLVVASAFTDAAQFTGIRAYVDNPTAAYNLRCSCPPCNEFVGDHRDWQERRENAGGRGWPLGLTEFRRDGKPFAIALCKSLPDMPTPSFIGVKNGVEVGKMIVGYDPKEAGHTLGDIFRLHPEGEVPFIPPTNPGPPVVDPSTPPTSGPPPYVPNRATVKNDGWCPCPNGCPCPQPCNCDQKRQRVEASTSRIDQLLASVERNRKEMEAKAKDEMEAKQRTKDEMAGGFSFGFSVGSPPVQTRYVPVPVAPTYVVPAPTYAPTRTYVVPQRPLYIIEEPVRYYVAPPVQYVPAPAVRYYPTPRVQVQETYRQETTRYSGSAQHSPAVVQQRYTNPVYYCGQTQWSWPGDLRQHMVDHGYSPSYISSLNECQLMQLHNSEHNSNRASGSGQQRCPVQSVEYSSPVRTYSAQRVTYSASTCPGGVCPPH